MAKSPKKYSHINAGRDSEKLNQIIREQKFESIEEAQSFIDKNINGKPIPEILKKFKKDKPVDKVTALIDKAYNSPPEKAVGYIDKALKLDPENPEALFFLAELEEDIPKSVDVYRKVIEISRKQLGESFFLENKGNFWLIGETRTFMRAMHSLGNRYLDLEKNTEALKVFEEMLELNPNDNQGVRDLYAPLLVLSEGYDKYRALRKFYSEENSAVWNYLYAVYLFRTAGTVPKFNEALRKAYKTNPHFVNITVGIEPPPEDDNNDYYSPGQASEAFYAMDVLADVIFDTDGFVAEFGSIPGVKEQLRSLKFNKKIQESPSIFPVAKFPREYLGFTSIKFKVDGKMAYAFFVVDAFSEFSIFLEAEHDATDKTVLSKIKQLMSNPDFVRHSGTFSIVLDDFEHLQDEIKKIIAPFNGNVIFNEAFCGKITESFLETMDEWLQKS